MADRRNIRGFCFTNDNTYNEALKESETIDYICSKADVRDPGIALKVYTRLSENHNFHTIVGYTFMKQLRDIVIKSGTTEDKAIPPVEIGPAPVHEEAAAPETGSDTVSPESVKVYEEFFNGEKARRLKAENETLKARQSNLLLVIAALALVIVGLFAITIWRGSLNLNDRETELQDRYSAWAEELDEREKALDARESALND